MKFCLDQLLLLKIFEKKLKFLKIIMYSIYFDNFFIFMNLISRPLKQRRQRENILGKEHY